MSQRLLLVDDEEHLRTMLAAALAHSGYEVETAANGRDALELSRSAVPDLILLDVMMPDLDGFEVCRRLRSEQVKTPIIFLTARDETGDKVRGLTLGGDDYLVKPFSLDELVARSKRYCDGPVRQRPVSCCAATTSNSTTTPTACGGRG